MEKKVVLYIHGWNGSPTGGTGTAVRNFFETQGFRVVSQKFDLADYEKTSAEINEIVKKESVNIVVGHSFGAFFALARKNAKCTTTVINPCMHPSAEIPKLGEVPQGFVEEFARIEKESFAHVPPIIKLCTFGIFGERDELFSCKDEFAQKYGCVVPADSSFDSAESANLSVVNGTHHLETDALIEGLKCSMEYYRTFSKIAQYNSIKTECMFDKKAIAKIEEEFSAWQKSEAAIYDAVEARIANGEELREWLEARKKHNQSIERFVLLAKPFAEWLEQNPLVSGKTPCGADYLHDLMELEARMKKEEWQNFVSARNESLKSALSSYCANVSVLAEHEDAAQDLIFQPLEGHLYSKISRKLHRMRHPLRVPALGEPGLKLRKYLNIENQEDL